MLAAQPQELAWLWKRDMLVDVVRVLGKDVVLTVDILKPTSEEVYQKLSLNKNRQL